MSDNPALCDGSCLLNETQDEEIPCEDGDVLRFFWCRHEEMYVLTYATSRSYLWEK